MKIGFMGCGKLGLPVALAIENKGHEVAGFDINKDVYEYIASKKIPYKEKGTPELLKKTKIRMVTTPDDLVDFADIVFVSIQTPHHPDYEGITRLPKKRVDFDYKYLINGVKAITSAAQRQKKEVILIIISTVLPGTIQKHIKPLLNKYTQLCYNPFFIAMGTTRRDFENPEFVLLGCNDQKIAQKIKNFYQTLHKRPVFITSIINAELTKVVYNTYISSKIAFINTVMEISHKVGADVDSVSEALSLSSKRIISSKYLRGGMGDGGGCHPRDNIAMSFLANKLKLSYDYFEHLMIAREKQTEWLADLVIKKHKQTHLPIVILGKAFKKGTNLLSGSPSLLLANFLKEKNIDFTLFDPWVDEEAFKPYKAIFFIGTNHDDFMSFPFPPNSVIFDPWGYIPPKESVELIAIGRQIKK